LKQQRSETEVVFWQLSWGLVHVFGVPRARATGKAASEASMNFEKKLAIVEERLSRNHTSTERKRLHTHGQRLFL
jgi:hypothetical protein